jgi:transcriptional regulator with XRE-family HTH domain
VELYKEVGRLIASYRKEKGISQEKLAALSDLHEDYIGKIERGERKPRLETIIQILTAMEVSISTYFLNLDKNLKR